MPFDNPIVAGTTLIRDAIKSPNYESGVAGWSINKDGTAEFQDAIVRADLAADNVSVNSTFTYQGRELTDILADSPAGEVSFGQMNNGKSSPATALLQPNANLFWRDTFLAKAGRRYVVETNGWGVQTADTGAILYYRTDGGTVTTSSPSISLGDIAIKSTDFQVLQCRWVFPVFTVDTVINFAIGVTGYISGGTQAQFFPIGSQGFVARVIDEGRALANSATITASDGTVVQGKTLQTLTLTPVTNKSYNTTDNTQVGTTDGPCYQGEPIASLGNIGTFSLIQFNSGIGGLQELQGIPLDSIVKAECRTWWRSWQGLPGGGAVYGFYKEGETVAQSKVNNDALEIITVWGSNVLNVRSMLGWTGFFTALFAGTLQGIVLGPEPAGPGSFGGWADGKDDDHPMELYFEWME